LNALARVRPIARWRLRATRITTSIVLALGAGVWVMSTDELNAFAMVLSHQSRRCRRAASTRSASSFPSRPVTSYGPPQARARGHQGVVCDRDGPGYPYAPLAGSLGRRCDPGGPRRQRPALDSLHSRGPPRGAPVPPAARLLLPRSCHESFASCSSARWRAARRNRLGSGGLARARVLAAAAPGDVVVLRLAGSAATSLRTVSWVGAAVRASGLAATPLPSSVG